MRVQTKFYGILKTAAKTGGLDLHFDTTVSVRQLVDRLITAIPHHEFEAYLIDADMKDPRPNTLILISGTEIGALNGLDTPLKDGDEVVFLPVVHGG